jgi:hypothetical protein
MNRVKAWWTLFGNWLNVALWRRGTFDIRRLDVMMAVMGGCIFGFYFTEYGWQKAVLATLTYVMVWMAAAWMF